MPKKLIIAEKPSVANDIARALGGFTRHGDAFESDDFVLCSAIGHLLELAAPEQFEVKRGKWSLANLPVIPGHFDLKPIERSEDRLRLLVKLLRRKDVTAVINACDAGREGELIFRYIMQHAANRKPIERLWLQSMTPAAIRNGFAKLRPDRDLLPLADAAVCRSEADWLVGINGTRAMTAFNSKEGGFYKTTVGRVQTPTLAILVEREERIRRFVARDYWELHATFRCAHGEYTGRWFDESFDRASRSEDAEARPERIWEHARAESLRDRCAGRPGVATEETRPSTQLAPSLFDLTSLQREANSRYGFSARMTLSLAQALYEKHKALTYPRTDARALPQDYVATVRDTIAMLAEGGHEPAGAAPYAGFAREILTHGWVKPNKRIFDDTKVSDHFAIIPTLAAPKHLNDAERRLYDMVVRRFLAVFFPAAEYLVTTRITRVDGEPFRTEGKVMLRPGWLAIYGRDGDAKDGATLPALDGPGVETRALEVRASQTRAPARFTEATLLSAMEGAGRLVEDEELREAMGDKGLGTPATRASIIEGLIYEDYVHRIGRELVPSPKAFSLLFALRHFGITELSSPELTGAWEFRLREIEHGRLPRREFMDHIVETTRDMVERVRTGNIPDEAYATLSAPCPRCGGVVQENYRKFQCRACEFALWRVIAGREFAPEEAEQLIRDRALGPLTGFRSRLGRPFAAALRLNQELKVEFDFGTDSGGADSAAEAPDFSGQDPLGSCPKCGARVFELPMVYACEKATGPARTCDFRSGRIILQREIEREQMRKLLADGRTDLLQRFISRKGKGRPFSAYLVRSASGKVEFEFAPRPAKAPRAGKSGAEEPGPVAPERDKRPAERPAPARAKKKSKPEPAARARSAPRAAARKTARASRIRRGG